MIEARHGDMDHGADSAMASDHGNAAGGHGHGDAAAGGHDMGMMVIFHNMMATSLFSEAWTPGSPAAYAGTCIFLVVLAIVMRLLLAGKAVLEQRWLDREMKRRYVVVADKNPLGQQLSSDSLAKQAVLSENGREENVTVVQRPMVGEHRPWRFSVDPIRACLDTVIAGVGYLLMLAVMSMNVGYFLSVLAGVFVGSLAVGRFYTGSSH